jgi:hypothetical protein
MGTWLVLFMIAAPSGSGVVELRHRRCRNPPNSTRTDESSKPTSRYEAALIRLRSSGCWTNG